LISIASSCSGPGFQEQLSLIASYPLITTSRTLGKEKLPGTTRLQPRPRTPGPALSFRSWSGTPFLQLEQLLESSFHLGGVVLHDSGVSLPQLHREGNDDDDDIVLDSSRPPWFGCRSMLHTCRDFILLEHCRPAVRHWAHNAGRKK